MTSGEKTAALDNLENLYSSAVSYIDNITHASLYYTDAQCDFLNGVDGPARFFTSATDGTGSGLICATLDGYTADQIINSGTPSGVIAWWSGSEIGIPDGWVLCNGLNSTPDLRNRFIVGAGSHYNRSDTGGANTVTTSATVTIAGHALTVNEIPLHTHGTIVDYHIVAGSALPANYLSSPGASYHNLNALVSSNYTGYSGSGDAHSHTASYSGSSSQEKRPPFYAMCAIMKS